jgi:hypothetical protein
MAIYLLKNGEKQGPYEKSIVAGWLINGTCSPQDLAWRDGMKEWQPLSTVLLLPEQSQPGGILIALFGGLILVGSIVVYFAGQSAQSSGMTGANVSYGTLVTLGGLGFFLGLALLITGIIVAAIKKR